MTKPSAFGSDYELSEKFIKDVMKSGVLDFVVSQAKAKEKVKVQKALSGKKASKLYGIPKLEDANSAGTKDSADCLLILTEGDSAKALAMAGLDVVGRDHYGVFPLRGKLLNVRDASLSTLKNNVEIQAIVKIMGLHFDRTYDDVSSLRYGGILIMADQDHDGSHIKGLIINFIHHFWPSLLHLNKFLKEFVTPVIKATKLGESPLSFFTIQDYRNWESSLPADQLHRYSVREASPRSNTTRAWGHRPAKRRAPTSKTSPSTRSGSSTVARTTTPASTSPSTRSKPTRGRSGSRQPGLKRLSITVLRI